MVVAKTYRGIRAPRDFSRKIVVVDSFSGDGRFIETKALRHHAVHSPDGFEWGYRGSGPADLAFSILADLYNIGVAKQYYQAFKFRFVAGFDAKQWEISSKEIDAWLESVRAVNVCN